MNLHLAITAFASLFIAFAAPSARADDAGCGLGSMIITDNTKLMQVLAVTSNAIGGQTFAISTGTSNCRAQNFVMNEKAIQYFAEANHEELSREMAQGQGEKLTVLASLYGCKGGAQTSFAKMTQTSFSKIVPQAATSTAQMVSNLNVELGAHPEVAGACSAI